ncbi:hypothetical protein CDAR_598721 [Caerostris darwini]|uniref:Uncharacterized protein n=1 Tax=Caerostris darwini TaxID=1538125 RepID=A0AAV4R7F9_9ARAC|nr:hypothetical protein CDAR_598721 [Caerostris darwini]
MADRNPNIRSPLPNPDSRWTSDKSTQTDATIERQAGSWIAELKTQIDSLINDLKMTSESYIPNAEGNQEQEIESARISMGDVHLDQILYPAVCSDNNVSR